MGITHWHKFLKDHGFYETTKLTKPGSDLVWAQASKENHQVNRWDFAAFESALETLADRLKMDYADVEEKILGNPKGPACSGTVARAVKCADPNNFTGAARGVFRGEKVVHKGNGFDGKTFEGCVGLPLKETRSEKHHAARKKKRDAVPEFEEWDDELEERWLAYVTFGLTKHQKKTITVDTHAMGISHWHKFLNEHGLYGDRLSKPASDLVFARARQEHGTGESGHVKHRVDFETFMRGLEHVAKRLGVTPEALEKMILEARDGSLFAARTRLFSSGGGAANGERRHPRRTAPPPPAANGATAARGGAAAPGLREKSANSDATRAPSEGSAPRRRRDPVFTAGPRTTRKPKPKR